MHSLKPTACSVLFLFFLLTRSALAAESTAEFSILRKISPSLKTQLELPGRVEMLVLLSEQADLKTARLAKSSRDKRRRVHAELRETARRSQAPLRAWLEGKGISYRAYSIANAVYIVADASTALAIAARDDVARIESNPHVKIPQEPISYKTNAPEKADTIETNIAYIHAPQVWARGYTGQGIVIGSQDTGVQWDHPALKNQYRGWNGTHADHDYNWHDAIHANNHGTNRCGVDASAPCDDFNHGTHTTGIAVGDDGGMNQIGVAPGARWIGCRNMDNGWGSPQSYLECFEFFLAPYPVDGDPAVDGNPDLAPDITINSWSCTSGEGCSDITVLRAAVQAHQAAGILTVSSAGNNGYGSCSTIATPPAIYPETYTVGALITGSDQLAYSSSLGPVTVDGSGRVKPDISAPGTARSSIPNSTYDSMSGTSMAVPHVAGAAALLWSALPSLKNDLSATIQRLNNTAYHLESSACGSSGWPNNTYGYGRLDIAAAISMSGDIDGDTHVDLVDVILALRILSGLEAVVGNLAADVNSDGQIGLPEAIFALQNIATE